MKDERNFGTSADIREFFEIGWSFKAVQELFGKTRKELNDELKKMGYSSYKEFKYGTIYGEYQEGMSAEGIARKWGMKPKSISRIINQLEKKS